VLLTFDDAFQDFADIAWPLLRQRGLGATVFVPTGRVAGADDWENGAGHAARRLMDWNQMRRLSAEGVEFGGHSVDHGDLTRLPEAELRRQVLACQQTLQAELGRPAVAFAPPYGCTTPAVRAVVSQFYQLSFGTALGQTRRGHDPWDLPRVEMHYFRSPARWRTHLEGGGAWWLSARRSLRAVRQVSERCWPFAVRVPTRAEA
jgi:peptidoglycan/xylan/chitin deacetylase (PgdA/CDA1 family)